MIEQVITELPDGRIQIDEYRIKKLRPHEKNAYKACIGERISTRIITQDTYTQETGKRLAKSIELLP